MVAALISSTSFLSLQCSKGRGSCSGQDIVITDLLDFFTTWALITELVPFFFGLGFTDCFLACTAFLVCLRFEINPRLAFFLDVDGDTSLDEMGDLLEDFGESRFLSKPVVMFGGSEKKLLS